MKIPCGAVLFLVLGFHVCSEALGTARNRTVFVNHVAKFRCTTTDYSITWIFNDTVIDELNTPLGDVVPDTHSLGGHSVSTLTVLARVEYNRTEIRCVSGRGDIILVVDLYVQDTLPQVEAVINESNASSITLSWTAPFSLDVTDVDPDILYSVLISNVTDDEPIAVSCSECINITETHYTFTPDYPSPCHKYNFTVLPLNGAGVGEPSQSILGQMTGNTSKCVSEEISEATGATIATEATIATLSSDGDSTHIPTWAMVLLLLIGGAMLVGVVAAVLGIFLFSMYNRKKKNAKDLERSLDSLEKGVEEETPKQEMAERVETVTSLLTHFADYWRDIAELLGSGHLLEEIYSIHKTDEACLRALVERQVEEQTLSDDKLQDIIEKMKVRQQDQRDDEDTGCFTNPTQTTKYRKGVPELVVEKSSGNPKRPTPGPKPDRGVFSSQTAEYEAGKSGEDYVSYQACAEEGAASSDTGTKVQREQPVAPIRRGSEHTDSLAVGGKGSWNLSLLGRVCTLTFYSMPKGDETNRDPEDGSDDTTLKVPHDTKGGNGQECGATTSQSAYTDMSGATNTIKRDSPRTRCPSGKTATGSPPGKRRVGVKRSSGDDPLRGDVHSEKHVVFAEVYPLDVYDLDCQQRVMKSTSDETQFTPATIVPD